MTKQVKDYLKNTTYAEGAIYKVSPHVLLEDFYSWLKRQEKEQIKEEIKKLHV